MKLNLFILLILCLSCGDDNFKKIEKLKGFRVLAIHTATPEVTPGATISDLTVFFSDPSGGGRTITGSTVSCIDPGISLGARVNCDHDPSRINGSFSINTASDDESSGFFTGQTSNAVAPFTIPPFIFAGRSTREQFNGVGYIVIFNFFVDGKSISSFKRIVATNRGSLNSNPSGSQILLNGSPIGTSPAKNDKFSVVSSSQENYSVIDSEGNTENRNEEFQIAWYVSQGEIDKPKTFINERVKYEDDKVGGAFVQLAIVRDERGGVEILRFYQ